MELKRLRLKGDFYYNVKILEIGGDMIVCRRPRSGINSSPHNYNPCKFCFGFYHNEEIKRHCAAKCSFKNNVEADDGSRIQKQCQMILYPNIKSGDSL